MTADHPNTQGSQVRPGLQSRQRPEGLEWSEDLGTPPYPHPESPSFTAVSPYYDVLMRDVPYRGWVRYLHQLFEVRGAKPHRILDLACGTGTICEMLAKQGYDVVGVDLSEGMIAEARRKAEEQLFQLTYHVQDASCMEVPGPPFDLCVSLFDSLNYITVPAALQAAVHRTFDHLRPGGLFIFDVNSAFALENGFFDQENLKSDDRLRYVWRSEYDPPSRLCHVHMRFFLRSRDDVDEEFREVHIQFAYGETELNAMLAQAGFTDIQTYHAYTLSPVRPTSDRIFFIAAKP